MNVKKTSEALILAEKDPVVQQKVISALNMLAIAKQTEEKKDEAYIEYLASIVESTDDAIISKSLEGKITSWNNGSEKMFGYTAKEAIGSPITMIIPPEFFSQEIEILKKIHKNEIIDHFETVRIKKNGEIIHVSLTISPLRDKTGTIVGASKIARDITLRKKSEEEILRINKELTFESSEKEKRTAELVVANQELAFQIKEKEKRSAELIIANEVLAVENNEKEKRAAELLVANQELAYQIGENEKRAAELIIAYEELAFQNKEKEKRAAELIIANQELIFQSKEKEKRAAELIIANQELIFQSKEKEKRAAELAIANDELIFQNKEKEKRAAELVIANDELIFQNKEKEKRAAELIIANEELIFQNKEKENRAAELLVANKELSFQNEEKEKRAAELITAISDLKVSEEQIIEVNKELESFSYSVSHDLRAPLRAINGYTKMLKANFETQLDPEANRLMNNIVNNANKMGRLIDDLLTFSRVGRRELVQMNINMDNIVTGICNEFKNEQPHRNIEFHIQPLPQALADNMAIKQVWFNLISNAVKYTGLKETALIEIGSEIKGKEIIYSVKDNGSGFDMRYAGKLFGVFQRLHSDEEFEGTGVGLALVHRIITKHGGRVWGEGKVNGGATFYFTLKNI